jgi:hypothetical protein
MLSLVSKMMMVMLGLLLATAALSGARAGHPAITNGVPDSVISPTMNHVVLALPGFATRRLSPVKHSSFCAGFTFERSLVSGIGESARFGFLGFDVGFSHRIFATWRLSPNARFSVEALLAPTANAEFAALAFPELSDGLRCVANGAALFLYNNLSHDGSLSSRVRFDQSHTQRQLCAARLIVGRA